MNIICPVCKKNLILEEKTYKCSNNHCFDLAKKGYLNLLTGVKSGDKIGDNKEMVTARNKFLSKDFYSPLGDFLKNMLSENSVVLDAGCGEGYYTKKLAENYSEVYAFDISKNAVNVASARDKKSRYFVASSYDIPFEDKSFTAVFSIFAPRADKEFLRVLKDDGKLICVVPGREHLIELKEKVYDNAYLNESEKHSIDGFILRDRHNIKYSLENVDNESIKALFLMTPYFFKTPKDSLLRLESIDTLNITCEFEVLVFEKDR